MFDIAKAREFYIDYLGFQINWEHRHDKSTPLYMEIGRGDCRIHLSEHYGDCTPGSALRIPVSSAKAFHQELQAKKYRYYNPGFDDQNREFIVQDPFGNRLIFFNAGAGDDGGNS